MVFANEESSFFMAGGFDAVAALYQTQPLIEQAFKSGGGVDWGGSCRVPVLRHRCDAATADPSTRTSWPFTAGVRRAGAWRRSQVSARSAPPHWLPRSATGRHSPRDAVSRPGSGWCRRLEVVGIPELSKADSLRDSAQMPQIGQSNIFSLLFFEVSLFLKFFSLIMVSSFWTQKPLWILGL